MIEISVDMGLCAGHGQCAAAAPRVYDLDDAGYCVVAQPVVGDDVAVEARAGAEACPERAIALSETRTASTA